MLIKNNPFAFSDASSIEAPVTPEAKMAASPLPQSFAWERLFVSVGFDAHAEKVQAIIAALTPPVVQDAPLAIAPVEAPVAVAPTTEAPMTQAEVAAAIAAATITVASTPATQAVAPAPALVQIAEPAAQAAPSFDNLPTGPAHDAAYDAYANLFRGIENRDLLAELQATLSPDSPWQGAFGAPLG